MKSNVATVNLQTKDSSISGRDVFSHNTITNNIITSASPTSDLHLLLVPVDDAAYASRAPSFACLEGTRDDVIGEIVRCVKGGDHPICWLSGSAGSGKSAVSQSIAKHYDDKGRLLASFFFLRGAGDRSVIARLIPTLAYQLSISTPATKPLIRDVIQNDPAIFSHYISISDICATIASQEVC